MACCSPCVAGPGYVARTLLMQWVPLAAFKLVIPVLISLVVIRVGAKVLQAAFPQAAWVRPIERSISWLAWLAMVLWVTGLLPLVLQNWTKSPGRWARPRCRCAP
jgi:hypothetical protein